MSRITVGDAVMTPLHELLRGIPENAVYQWEEDNGVSHSTPIGRLAHEAADELGRLVPDDGLRERVQAFAESLKVPLPCDCYVPGYGIDCQCRDSGDLREMAEAVEKNAAAERLLALLDTQEAEPEVWTCGCHYMNSGSICTKCARPKPSPPPAAVTREELEREPCNGDDSDPELVKQCTRSCFLPDGSLREGCLHDLEPPPAAVTREKLAQALEVVAWCVEHGDGDPALHFAAWLREEG